MADLAHMNTLLNYHSPFLKSRISPNLPNFSPLRPRLSLFPTLCSSPNLLLISTSVQSDGSLVFKFGDSSEIPPAVENADVSIPKSDDVEIEAELEMEIDDNLAVNDETVHSVSNVENGVEDVTELKYSAIEVAESKEIAKESASDAVEAEHENIDLVVTSEIEHSGLLGGVNTVTDDDSSVEDIKLDVMTKEGFHVENLDSEAALEDEKIDDAECTKGEMIKHDVDEVVEEMEVASVQLEVETVLDEEVNNNAGSPSIAGLEDLSTDDSEDAACPSLEESVVTSAEAIIDRKELSPHSGDISILSLSMSSASLSHPSMVNDAVPSSVLQSDDDTESRNISEPACPGPNSSGTASAEAILDSVQISTGLLSAPSATVSLSQDIEVNDADIPSTQQSDDDLSSDIHVAVHPGQGISATAEISAREEISTPTLCLVSAAASIAHSAEALAGGDDAYFVCENWFGVADGIGQWSFGGIDKGLYAQEFIKNCERLARDNLNTGLCCFKELLQQSAAMTESSGAASVLIAHIADQVLHVANIGDSGFVIIRNRTVFKKSSPMCHEFNFPCAISSGDNPVEVVEEYHVELEEGDIIVMATDGLFDNLYEHEIVYLVCKAVEDGKKLKDIAELLALRSQEVGRSSYARTPFADAAQAAGHPEFSGGKFDHVTVIVSAVQIK